MVLHKLVNSTNVVFHMLDLQPYAMVLPMDKLTSDKNKKKILSKIFKNNADTYAAYRADLKIASKRRGSEKSESAQKAKGEPEKNDRQNSETNAEPSGVPEVAMSSPNEGPATEPDTSAKEESEATDAAQGSGDANSYTERSAELNNGTSRDQERADSSGYKGEDRGAGAGNEHEGQEEEDMFSGVRRFIDRIDSENIIGCMIILASKSSDKTSISPVAGGIVEVFDDYERSIQTVWLNSNIGECVNFTNLKGKKNSKKLIESISDQILAKVVLSTLTLRLCAHAYQMTLPNSKRTQHKSRLISIYHQMGQTFPQFAYSFIKEEMQFSKHYEIVSLAIKHNDNPKIPCKCLKPGPGEAADGPDQASPGANSPLFFGITESRFSGMYNSTYEPILVGFMNLLSGKLNDISKIVRFKESVVSFYEEEDDYKAKRQKVNLRSRRLQSRM